ncbi:MAG: hypothetical protein ACRDYY_10860, partial [Acidimicrobiales bacterium]
MTPPLPPADAGLADAAERLAGDLLVESSHRRGYRERARAARVGRMLSDPDGLGLVLALTDEVLRIHDP